MKIQKIDGLMQQREIINLIVMTRGKTKVKIETLKKESV